VHRHSSSAQLSTAVEENSCISRRASEERRALVRAPTSTKDQYRCTQRTEDRDATDATKVCHHPMPPHKMQDSRKRRGHIPLPRHVEFPALRAEAPLTWVRASPLVRLGRAGRDTPKSRSIARPRRAHWHAPGVLHNPIEERRVKESATAGGLREGRKTLRRSTLSNGSYERVYAELPLRAGIEL